MFAERVEGTDRSTDGRMDGQMNGIEPDKCGGASTVWDMGLLEVPCECQYVGSRESCRKGQPHTTQRGAEAPFLTSFLIVPFSRVS